MAQKTAYAISLYLGFWEISDFNSAIVEDAVSIVTNFISSSECDIHGEEGVALTYIECQ